MDMYKSIECPLAMYRNQLNQLAYEECFQQHGMEKGSEYHRAIYRMLEQRYPMMAKDEMKNDVQRMYGTMSRLRGCDIKAKTKGGDWTKSPPFYRILVKK